MARVYFVTNRNYTGQENLWFGKDLSLRGDLRFGFAEINSSCDFKVNDLHIYPDNEDQGSEVVFNDLQSEMRRGKDTVIYIHGHNTDFIESLKITAKCIQCVKAALDNTYEPNVIVFSWPADGQLIKYLSDRRDAKASSIALYRAIIKYYYFIKKCSKKNLCKRKLHLICHSMGNYVLRNGIQEIMKEIGSIRLFDEVILIGADEDNDTFELHYKMEPLVKMARRITVYFNRNDSALLISDNLKGNPDRLGVTGPINTNKISHIIKPVDVERALHSIININKNHGYHVHPDCTKIHADIGWTLMGIPSEDIPGRKLVKQSRKFVLK